MSKHLPISETARLIHDLRTTAANLSEAAARLEKEGRQRAAGFHKQIETEVARVRKQHAELRAAAEDNFEARTAYLTERKKARETRITKSFLATRKQLLDQIDETEGRRKFAVQKGILDEEKRLHARLAELEQQFKSFQQEAANERHAIAQLRQSARKSFRAYPFFRLPDSAGSSGKDLAAVRESREGARSALRAYRLRVVPEIFRFTPVWLWLIILLGFFLAGPERVGLSPGFKQVLAASMPGILFLYVLGWFLGKGPAAEVSDFLSNAEKTLADAETAAESAYAHDSETERKAAREKNEAFQRDWEYATAEATQARADTEATVETRGDSAYQQNERLHSRWETEAEESLQRRRAELEHAEQTLAATVRAEWEDKSRRFQAEHETQWNELRREWASTVEPAQIAFAESQRFAQEHFAPWTSFESYRPAEDALNALKFGSLKLQLPSPFSADAKSGLNIDAPLLLTLPAEGSILIESDEAGRPAAIDTLNNIVYRVLQTVPPGKAAFTLIDPARLGQSFSSIMHLADFEENIVNRRIWTEPGEIEERLLELNAHMEKVIQMYLRNEFENIVEYNKQAGRIAEKYHFLLIADFPASFTETALRRLAKIATSGARCGVFTLIHWDKRGTFFPVFDPQDLASNSVHLQVSRAGVVIPKIGASNVRVELDPPPPAEIATRFLQEVGEASRGSNTVQVPFAQIEPPPAQRWTLDATEELRVPIGRSGATKLQYLSLGKGTRQHVLIAGKTGSGKSTLLHVLVTNLALWASPDEVEFYLVDFKKGVEFKDYSTAKLPHARVVAIESDREFGLSVLRRVDEELRKRGELFRAAGAQDLPGYKRAVAGAKMPRVLLIVDEFQELFVEDDSISQNAALLLDRIVRQGRAFGIHVILGSQTLGGAYSLARSTLGQMVVRIALQTNEADAYLIMDESNPAPRLLSRPGEGIYNDSGGTLEANSPFQVVWLPETERRQALERVRTLARERRIPSEPIVFEGNTLADLSQNPELLAPSAGRPVVWLGLPNEIKDATHVLLDNRTGKNLLIAGQQEDHVRALFASALLSLSRDDARVILLEPPVAGTPLNLAELAAQLPNTTLAKPNDLASVLRDLVTELERRESTEPAAPIFLLVYNLSAFKPLRPEDEFSLSLDAAKPTPAADFQRLYTDGPVHRIHVIAHVDGFNNANRFLGRKGLKEFSLRVLFQMSATDSASFSDDARAGSLGLNRALLFNEQEGTYETFRPYALPDPAWLRKLLENKSATSK